MGSRPLKCYMETRQGYGSMINGPFLMGKCFKYYTIISGNGSVTDLNCILTYSVFLSRHRATNSLRGRENSPSRVGGSVLGMRKSAFIGCRLALGGSPRASSIAVIPSDQMSAY